MEQIDNKIKFIDKLISFYNNNKLKIYSITIILLTLLILITFLKLNNKKKNDLIAEKYIKAGLYLTANKEKSIEIYEEIILSKNKFYSILALNTILEKDLVLDNKKILYYFTTIDEIRKSKEQNNLISFKRALYLIKTSNIEEGKKILKDLINKNSKLKNLAEEILAN